MPSPPPSYVNVPDSCRGNRGERKALEEPGVGGVDVFEFMLGVN
jgi:hypothetical protein